MDTDEKACTVVSTEEDGSEEERRQRRLENERKVARLHAKLNAQAKQRDEAKRRQILEHPQDPNHKCKTVRLGSRESHVWALNL